MDLRTNRDGMADRTGSLRDDAEIQAGGIHIAQIPAAVIAAFELIGIQLVSLLIEALDVFGAQ